VHSIRARNWVYKKEINMEHFIRRDDGLWAGVHLLIEIYDAKNLDNVDHVRTTLLQAAEDIGATVLGDFFHDFPGGGVTGIVALAESHFSVHSWTETNYAAVDIFTCGDCDPNNGIKALKEGFDTDHVEVTQIFRGKQKI
jgi:S-adenosylmethionine decarboxylase